MLVPYDSPVIDEIRETGLTAGDFYRESHATIYKAALELQAERIEPDAIALTDRLETRGTLEQVGGRGRIHELAGIVPATANAAHYARIVHEMSALRGLIATGQMISRLGWERPGDTNDLLEQARTLVDHTANGSGPAAHVHVVTLAEFTAVTDEHVEPLIGTSDETLLPADGMLLMYGDGGAGKTSLSIDALAHLAAGTDWLGHPIPRPARCLLIENEGPRGPFRRRLKAKINAWQGRSFTDNVHVLEEPWTQFTLADAGYRRGLAKEIDRTKTELVIVGPLASLGAKGTGTPDDVNEFAALISDLKARADTQFALWIVHHENKAGDVSGAWERVPDTLVHVSAQGNGRTRVAWRKVRWSSTLHNTSVNLLWAENTGFTIELPSQRDIAAEIADYLAEHPRATTNDVTENVKGTASTLRTILKDDPRFTYETGPNNSFLWSGAGNNLLDQHQCVEPATTHPDAPDSTEDGSGASGGSLPVRETRQDAPTSPVRREPRPTDQPDDDPRAGWFDE